MDLNEITVFAKVVQAGSFTAAAKQLGMPKSTVSRKVAELEQRLDARLLQRTTRKLNLTDAGRTYYDYCARIVSEVDEAERAVTSLQAAPKGLLRVTAPINMSFLAASISSYLKRYPEVSIDLFCTGRTVDLVEERFDVGIRAGVLADSTLIARSLGTAKWFMVATPAYLKKRGRPRSPEDLKRHDCLLFGPSGHNAPELRLESAGKSLQLSVSARLMSGDSNVLHSSALANLGIAVLPAFECVDDLRAHRLERVLSDWNPPSTGMHVVYPSTKHLSPKVKTFVDHLQHGMTPLPWELGPLPE
ncbi:MAG TPA: LysR family transcriptional regulator [Polyangiaceae bacterium]|nr:LysR family transcriptional regulator [Polyangiaceae bacterium]